MITKSFGAVLLTAGLAVSALAGCGTLDATGGPSDSDLSGGESQSGTAVKGPSGSAVAALKKVTIKGRASETGYSRDEFGTAWKDTDQNGCDQRNDVLRRDLTDETIKARTKGCIVTSGTLKDPYTGTTIKFRKADASAVQIDHLVALQNAWVTGAFKWTEDKRELLANDPLNLLAVDGPTNSSKGAGDAATWLPPRKAARCAYVARQIAVKVKYDAWMTKAEHSAIEDVLDGCPEQKLPEVKTIPRADDSGSKPDAGKDPGAGGGGDANPGSFCSPEGAKGTSEAGTKLKCTSKNGEKPRWRSAAG